MTYSHAKNITHILKTLLKLKHHMYTFFSLRYTKNKRAGWAGDTIAYLTWGMVVSPRLSHGEKEIRPLFELNSVESMTCFCISMTPKSAIQELKC